MCATLSVEQCRIQPIPEVSPPWWNLAHTSWFFVRNVIQPFGGKESKDDKLFDYVLNSYYANLGPRLEQHKRGLMTRPTMQEVYEYRKSVDERVLELLETIQVDKQNALHEIIHIGLQHEQQHQELFYTEIKYILFQNPIELRDKYIEKKPISEQLNVTPHKSKLGRFIEISSAVTEFGNIDKQWGWDNEFPAHTYYLKNYAINNFLVTNQEYLEFIEDGGYSQQLLWLDNGWNVIQQEKWQSPLYWEKIENEWYTWTLSGMKKLAPNEPVCHVSFYEADAFAAWKKSRLPTEREWEHAARLNSINIESYLYNSNQGLLIEPNFINSGEYHPRSINPNRIAELKDFPNDQLFQVLGDVWEWTSSYYEPYPGYEPFKGVLQEYNQKFMDNQRVLRGGSCVSEPDHIRISYRNFWAPTTRFQFSGIRLAQNRI